MNFKTLAAIAALTLLAACNTNSSTDSSATSGSGSSSGVATPGSQEDLANKVGDKVYFDTDRSSLTSEAKATLDRQTDWLGKYSSNAVQVAGNADERGTVEYNLALGQRRANAAKDYLVAKGVASSRISTISYGKEHPIAMGSDEAAWAQNRNATTSVK